MHGILTILHLGLLRMFIPSIDMIGIVHTCTLLQFCRFVNSVFVLISSFSLQLYLFSFFSVPLGNCLLVLLLLFIVFFSSLISIPFYLILVFFLFFYLLFSESSKIFCSSPFVIYWSIFLVLPINFYYHSPFFLSLIVQTEFLVSFVLSQDMFCSILFWLTWHIGDSSIVQVFPSV